MHRKIIFILLLSSFLLFGCSTKNSNNQGSTSQYSISQKGDQNGLTQKTIDDSKPTSIEEQKKSQQNPVDIEALPVDIETLPENTQIHLEENLTPPEEIIKTTPLPFSTSALIETSFSGHSLSLEAIESSNAVYTRYRIFDTSNGFRISGILNIPTGVGPFPLIILNHGYIDPAIYTVGRGLKREQDYLARAGYAVLHTDYRNHGLSDNDDSLEKNYVFRNYFYTQDSINAIIAVQESELSELQSIDSKRVGMLGHSMGGGVTMHAIIAQPNLINAAVLYAPVHSSEWHNFNRRRSNDLTVEEKNERQDRIGDLTVENFMPYSATPYVDQIKTPTQIYFGTNDESVPYQWGLDIQEIFDNAGIQSELITYEGEKHEFIRERNNFMQGVVEFFDEKI